MRPLVETSIAIGAVVLAGSAASQSISDYSHAQGALLEAGMTQAAARLAALGASSAIPAASVASTASPSTTSRSAASPEALVLVDGVFEGGSRSLAAVTVDGRPYILAQGQPVPGTSWHVAQIAVDRVVLGRTSETGSSSRAPRLATRTFTLPAPAFNRSSAP